MSLENWPYLPIYPQVGSSPRVDEHSDMAFLINWKAWKPYKIDLCLEMFPHLMIQQDHSFSGSSLDLYERLDRTSPIKWRYWVGCFGSNGPLRQYFSLYRVVSQRGRKKRNDRR